MQRPDEASQVQALAVVVEKAGADGFETMGFAASPKNRYLENVCRFASRSQLAAVAYDGLARTAGGAYEASVAHALVLTGAGIAREVAEKDAVAASLRR
jgi:hypothetical protein